MIGLDHTLEPVQVANDVQLTGVLLDQLLAHGIRIRGGMVEKRLPAIRSIYA